LRRIRHRVIGRLASFGSSRDHGEEKRTKGGGKISKKGRRGTKERKRRREKE
jgi:hypothetical protein